MSRKRILGCSFPAFIVILLAIVAMLVISFIGGAVGKSMVGDVGLPSWLSVPQPHPELPAEVVFHIGGFPITNSVIGAWVTIAFVVLGSFVITRRLRIMPRRWQALLEFALGALLNFCQSVAGEKNGRLFFPLVTTIFLFVIFNAWLSLLPGFGSILVHTAEGEAHLLRGANTDINMPLALALVSFVFVEYYGLRVLGIRYLGKFINIGGFLKGVRLLFRGKVKESFSGMMMGAIDMFVGVLEGLSEFIRIISFTFRLFGNMTAGEILLLIIAFLVPFVAIEIFYGLELLVGFVQALIFAGLTLIFATVAVTHHEG